MVKTVAILGGHIQALGLARQVHEHGEKTIVITDDRCSVARWSNAVDEVMFYQSREELIKRIDSLKSLDEQVMLFPTSDDYIDLIVAHYDAWKDQLYLAIPQPETVALFANKRNTYQFCEQHDIPHPKSYYPNTMEDVKTIATEVEYPCVVKPGVMYSFHKLLGKKAYLANNADELIAIFARIELAGFPIDKMLVQQFLSGGAKVLYSYGAFCADGEVKASIQANRIRQNPMDFGNSTTFAIGCAIPQIEEAGKRILELTHYTGMGEVEFMYDEDSGEYNFLEINTRAWKWHTMSNGMGFSFIGAWLDWLHNKEIKKCKKERTIVSWCERLTDWTVCAKEICKGKMRLVDVVRTYKMKPVKAVWSWKDPLPAIMYIALSPILYMKRY